MPDLTSPSGADLIVILSGPAAAESQARTALAARGFDVHPGSHDHGLSAAPGDEEKREAVSFITVRGNHPDEALEAVSGLGWRLRMHHHAPEEVASTVEDDLRERLDRMERELVMLRANR